MTFDDMAEAVKDARRTIDRADTVTDQMARLIAGRLRAGKVSGYTLKELKRELRDFNIHTGMWREKE